MIRVSSRTRRFTLRLAAVVVISLTVSLLRSMIFGSADVVSLGSFMLGWIGATVALVTAEILDP